MYVLEVRQLLQNLLPMVKLEVGCQHPGVTPPGVRR